MKKRKIRNYMIALSILALVAGSLQLTNTWIQPAKAQFADGSVKFISNSLGGIVTGQIVRITVGAPRTPRSTSIAFQSKFFDQDGNLAFQSSRTEVPADGFRKDDVLHGALGMVSEAGTGRKQVRMEVLIEGRNVSASDLIVNLEILDEATGITVVDLDKTLISNFVTPGAKPPSQP